MIYTICGGCGREIPKGEKCTVCSKERYKTYNKYKRNSESARFYNSLEWKRLRDYVYKKFNHLCLMCLIDDSKINKADTIHHIIPISDDWNKRLVLDNLIPLCHT